MGPPGRPAGTFIGTSATLLLPLLAMIGAGPGRAADAALVQRHCACGYDALLVRLHKAITADGMVLVAEASPTGTAAAQGFTIPGDTVAMVFRNDFARRIVAIAPESMIEPPIRIHLRTLPDKTAVLEYNRPSDFFARYGNPALTPITEELDAIIQWIADMAVSG